MNTSDRFLRTLDPPPRGWQRLIERRDAGSSSWLAPLTSLVCAVAVLVVVFPWMERQPIELDLSGARLVGARSTGTTLQMLDGRKTVELSSSDPNVKVYWVEGEAARAAAPTVR
jgi:hypothetical protein